MAVLTPILKSQRDGYEGGRIYQEQTYLVETTDLADGSIAARLAVLDLGFYAGWYCSKLTSEPWEGSPLWFKVEIAQDLPIWPIDPTLRPAVLTGDWDEVNKIYTMDCSSTPQPVLTSALNRLDPPPQRKTGKPTMRITKNLTSYPVVAYDAIKYTRNADAVTIKGTTYAAGTLLFLPPTVQENYEQISGNVYHYFATGYRLSADHLCHVDLASDRDYDQWITGGTGAIRVPILDKTGQRVTSPWPLDGLGHAMPHAGDTPATLTFVPYALASWGLDFS